MTKSFYFVKVINYIFNNHYILNNNKVRMI
jgi:hypothetical protein